MPLSATIVNSFGIFFDNSKVDSEFTFKFFKFLLFIPIIGYPILIALFISSELCASIMQSNLYLVVIFINFFTSSSVKIESIKRIASALYTLLSNI